MGIDHLLKQNAAWAAQAREANPNFFSDLANGHFPKYLWIGCADARVPANELLKLPPGDVFVHRNVGNQAGLSDPNFLAVLQYAVEALQIKDILVCGHSSCGGMNGAVSGAALGFHVSNWITRAKKLYEKFKTEIDTHPDIADRANQLAIYNVWQQILNVGQSPIVQQAWQRGAELTIHGLYYKINDGILHSLGECLATPANQITISESPEIQHISLTEGLTAMNGTPTQELLGSLVLPVGAYGTFPSPHLFSGLIR